MKIRIIIRAFGAELAALFVTLAALLLPVQSVPVETAISIEV